MDPAADRPGVEAIDTAFVTPTIYDVVTGPLRIELVERTLAEPLTKRYAIAEAFAEWARWDVGFVADDGGRIVGFAGVAHEAWHRRLVLWHLYVVPERRRAGIGRALLARVETHARTRRASHVWLETSNVNVPGIAAYARLGYTLCGADTRYYDRYAPDAAAIYLAKPLT
jgi:ribosomal protein S18 acetylase RimI-like enzyme